MITPLSISEINKKADYSVERDEITGSYDFTTDYGVQISIDFDDDFMITSSVSYQLIIGNANNKKSPRDHKLQRTVYDNNLRYSIHTVCIKDEEGIDNFAALIIRNDNPNIADAVNEFMQTALALQSKPQNN